MAALAEWGDQGPIAALALGHGTTQLYQVVTSAVYALPEKQRDAWWREPGLPHDFWVAERWPLEAGWSGLPDNDAALCVRAAGQLVGLGVDWPPV